MAHITFDFSLLQTLLGKVVVLTGGATGIGRSCVQQFCNHGAKVVFGDVSEAPSLELQAELAPNAHFVKCDTSNYSDQLALFRTAHDLYGKIDVVAANAGISIPQNIFDPAADITQEPSMKEVDINLVGALFSARIGMHYLRKNGGGDLVLTSSIAGFKECGGLPTYTASKHGVIGIMRGLHLTATPENIRINVVCPWMTRTRMVLGIEKGWYERGLPVNEPEDVARSIIICATANRGDGGKTHRGAALPFAGKIVLEPVWLGEENSKVLAAGQAYLASEGTSWDETKMN
ncbi:15-hydroxyprostaglandin dehydrogenase [Penicillium chermesinum]|nr:15-hydroxyprostaglandin dehydrogenase [Penicillium chermesinum]